MSVETKKNGLSQSLKLIKSNWEHTTRYGASDNNDKL